MGWSQGERDSQMGEEVHGGVWLIPSGPHRTTTTRGHGETRAAKLDAATVDGMNV